VFTSPMHWTEEERGCLKGTTVSSESSLDLTGDVLIGR
jgi:hypothetical protein